MKFSKSDIAGLKAYRYSGIDKSLISVYFLNPYWWSQLIKIFPLWFAPNLITLSGLGFVLINLATLLWKAPTLEEECEWWVYLSFGVGLFLYQSFDAIDGKQARRTGTSGPLGELFDHGCDALNTTISGILAANALNLGQSWSLVLMVISALANFYLSTWEEYHTGTLYLSYFSGPGEGIISLVIVHFIAAAKGPAFFNTPLNQISSMIPSDIPLNIFLLGFGAAVVLFNVVSAGYNVILAKRARNESSMEAFTGLFPFLIFTALIYAWLLSSSSSIVSHNLLPFLIGVGLLFSYQVGLMILAHVCHREFPGLNAPYLFLMSLGIVSSGLIRVYYNGGNDNAARLLETRVVYIFMLASLAVHARFSLLTIEGLCKIFDINCLTIKRKSVTSTADNNVIATQSSSSSTPTTRSRNSARRSSPRKQD